MDLSLARSTQVYQWPGCHGSRVSCHNAAMAAFHRVAAYAPPGAVGLGLGLTSAIFRSRPGLTTFEFDFCTASPGRLATDLGVPVLVEHGPELFAGADLILLLPGESFAEPPPGHVIS